MARYPQALFGVPVYYPQQPGVYVYHNRALWPFVTAYALKARPACATPWSRTRGELVAAGRALNLSNMRISSG